MTVLQAALLGIIEGITEFLPISSTGHLILAERLLGISITESIKTFDIAIQLGAILAVVVLYAGKLLRDRTLCLLTVLAFIPTAAVGLLLHGVVKDVFLGSAQLVAWSLLLGGIVLIVFELTVGRKQLSTPMNTARAFWIGVFQSLALVPGVSRAGATIVGGMLLGVPRKTIVEFSFVLAMPTMLGATVLDVTKSASSLTSGDISAMAVGFFFSFITALFAVKWLLRFIQHHTFIVFGMYRIVVGVLFLLVV